MRVPSKTFDPLGCCLPLLKPLAPQQAPFIVKASQARARGLRRGHGLNQSIEVGNAVAVALRAHWKPITGPGKSLPPPRMHSHVTRKLAALTLLSSLILQVIAPVHLP